MGNLLRNASLALLATIAVGCGAGAPQTGEVGESIKVENLPAVAGCDSLSKRLPTGAMLQRIEGVEDLYLVRDAGNQPRCIDSLAGAQHILTIVNGGGTLERAASNPMPGVDPSGSGSDSGDASSNPMPGVDPAASNPMPGNSGHK